MALRSRRRTSPTLSRNIAGRTPRSCTIRRTGLRRRISRTVRFCLQGILPRFPDHRLERGQWRGTDRGQGVRRAGGTGWVQRRSDSCRALQSRLAGRRQRTGSGSVHPDSRKVPSVKTILLKKSIPHDATATGRRYRPAKWTSRSGSRTAGSRLPSRFPLSSSP